MKYIRISRISNYNNTEFLDSVRINIETNKPMDLRKARQDFPILQESAGKKPVIYFDTACQSLRPRQVIDAINHYYLTGTGLQRAQHAPAGSRGDARCRPASRAALAKFFNAARKEEIVFTRNTTEGINLVAHSLGLQSGDAVLISDKEHNSNLIPWQMLGQKARHPGADRPFQPG